MATRPVELKGTLATDSNVDVIFLHCIWRHTVTCYKSTASVYHLQTHTLGCLIITNHSSSSRYKRRNEQDFSIMHLYIGVYSKGDKNKNKVPSFVAVRTLEIQ